ncbi:RICIN domain-containing protein [Streptomyces sp. AN091965]|uniref:RICIN domain-containing protein n=1 Tax=Streptomyces sp. AN091965 TaxID=2927803 RepID=UPI001F60782A|nr:RICIN domain-containing protein [Streptomyces sp. AN091965]MCI3928757.1 ricin-type beta-trefoil lectin domain protein [Streptomyces sp. AN091965]
MGPRNRLSVFAAALAALFALAAAPGAGAAGPSGPSGSEDRAPRVGPFQIKNHGVGRCMGFPAGDDRMRVWNCTSEPYQLWDLIADGRGAYHVATRSDGRCLAGWAQGPERWATWLSDCDRSFTNVDQLWYVNPAHSADPATIANLFGRVLEPDRAWGGANETPVVIHSPNGQPNQQWKLIYGP